MKQVVAALMVRDGRILICQRTQHQTMPFKWEFPGGKIETGEQPRDALRRELDEELGIGATIGNEVACLEYAYSEDNTVELRFFLVRDWEGQIDNHIFNDIHWVRRGELPGYDFLAADQKLIQDIALGKLLTRELGTEWD